MEKIRNVRQLRRTFLLLNPLFVLSVFRENRWNSERIDGQNRHCFFGCWLIVFFMDCSS